MKPKHFLYGFVAITACFAGVMAYLVYSGSSAGNGPAGFAAVGGFTWSGESATARPGKLIVAYTGDIQGSLDPCG